MEKYGMEIDNLQQWADLAYRNGDYEEAFFLHACVLDWKLEVAEIEKRYRLMERREDELACGMRQIKNLLEDLRTDVQQSSRLNRKEILARLREAIQEFDEYI